MRRGHALPQGFAMTTDPMQLAWKDGVIALLVMVLGTLAILTGELIPELGALSKIGTALVGGAFGGFLSSVWSARIAERTEAAVSLLALKDSNVEALRDEHLVFRHFFWRSQDERGTRWRYTRMRWRRIANLPVATSSARVQDQYGDKRSYDFMMIVSRARITVFITGKVSGEPTAVAMFDAPLLTGRLYGLQRHLTWANKERVSAAVIATDAAFKEMVGDDGIVDGRHVKDDLNRTLDDHWRKGYTVEWNIPQHAMCGEPVRLFDP
jgi:pimeloyl-ACP methyl ester carboxylesterase